MIHPMMEVWIMEFSDRIGWVLLGMVLGYVLRLLQDLKKEVHEVDEIVTRRERRSAAKQRRVRDEGGFMQNRIVADVIMVLVFSMCLWATISTGATNNKLRDAVGEVRAQQVSLETNQKADEQTQLRLARITVCTQEYLTETIVALNTRTKYTQKQANANVLLQKAQTEFLQVVLVRPPVSEADREAALRLYVARLEQFVDVAQQSKKATQSQNYPTAEQLNSCLNTPTDDERANPDLSDKD